MKVAVKLAVLPAMLLIPLLFVGERYLAVQDHTISVGHKEQTGITYLRPAYQLLLDVDQMRDNAISGSAAGSDPQVSADLSALDKVTPGASSAMPALPGAQKLTSALSQAESAIAAAQAATGRQASLAAWNAASAATLNLILQDSNDSTLVLDDQLDSYYTMDAVMNRAPTIVDGVGQLAGLSVVPGAAGSSQSLSTTKALVLGNIDSAYSALSSDLDVAFQSTHDSSLRRQLTGVLGNFAATEAVVDKAASSGTRQVDWVGIDNQVQAQAAAFGPQAMNGLNTILAARVSGLESAKLTAEGVTLAILALALAFFAMVWRTVMVPLLRLRDRMDNIATGDGDLTARVDDGRNDEIGDLGRSFNVFIGRLQGVMSAFTESIEALLSASEALGAITVDTRRNADQTAATASTVTASADLGDW
jgi:methyl-accepting chemotaxis protein